MKHHLLTIAFAVTALFSVVSCRTSEANYRAAYEKARAGREDAIPVDSTIYGKVRREMRTTVLVAGNDTVAVRVIPVNPTPDENGRPTAIPSPYGVVAGQFKTLFNARSLCKRLHGLGYDEASVVNTSEPYYYVVISWHNDGAQAAGALRKIEHDAPVVMREPLPFVLHTNIRH